MTISKIINGFLQFRRRVLPSMADLFSSLAHEQSPSVLLVACADSRLVPSRLVSSDPGEVFEVRTVGNLIAPAGASGVSSGDISEAAAIEYGVGVLGVQDIVVLGHSACGAMSALLAGTDLSGSAPNLASWLDLGRPAVQRIEELSFPPLLSQVDRLSQANVLVQLDHVATYPVVRQQLDAGDLAMHGAWLDIGSGDLYLLDRDAGCYQLLDDAGAERMLELLSNR